MTVLAPIRASGPPPADEKPFKARGRMHEVWGVVADEVMVAGPAGTGKSRAILEYLYALCRKNDGIRVLIVRATRRSLTESALVTFEDHVIPGRPAWVANQKRWVRQSYQLPNGSEIVVGGLDNTARFMSTEFDVIYVQEAREIDEASWEDLTSRLRNGKLPFQMMIGDTNPDGPSHWIMQRVASGTLRLIESRHEDNPVLYDERSASYTPAGEVYLGRLDNLTGVRKKRLRDGLWVGAENMVYEDWDPAVHVIDPIPIEKTWRRFRAVDFGFTNPFSCLWGALDEDGRLFIYREVYGTQKLVRDWAHLIHDLSGAERFEWTVTDHDLDGRDDLDTHLGHTAAGCRLAGVSGAVGITDPAVKAVAPGIERVAQRLRRAGDGSPRLFVFRDALVERDPLLVEAKQPCGLVEEFSRYQWARARSQLHGEILLEEPLKRFDHSLDALRYMVQGLDGADTGFGASLGQGMRYGGARTEAARPSRRVAR